MIKKSSSSAQRGNKDLKCYSTQVLGGKLKGKKILIPAVSTTRSSKSILRESLFNTLQFDIIGKNFVEVFAGSGSVGLEASSRGAQKVFFIERNNSVYKILEENIEALAIENYNTVLGDSFEVFPSLLNLLESTGIRTYFYFDPPFSTRDGMDDIYDKTLELISTIDAGICEKVIMEHMSSLSLPEEIGSVVLEKRKKFGKSTISYYTPKGRLIQ